MSMLLRLRVADSPGQSPNQLHRCLHLHDLLFFGVASVVGAGIFVTVGVAGREAGPGLVLAFFLAGLCCAPTALCYAELATRFPVAGSVYNFVSRTLGDYFAFVVGFALIVDGMVSVAAVSKACTAYLAQVLLLAGIRLPAVFVDLEVNFVVSISLLSPVVLSSMGFTAYKGVKTMSRFNNLITSVNMFIIAVLIVAGMFYIQAKNFDPFLPNGLPGVERAAALSFFAMLGFDSATSLAEETVEPERIMPRAILWTVAITTVMYMCISVVFCGMVPTSEIDYAAPLAAAFRTCGAPIMAAIIAVGAVGNTATTLLGYLARVPRFMLRMASDGHLPKNLAEVDPATDAPTAALAFTLCSGMLMSTFISFSALVMTASVGGLIGFSLVNASVLLCRCRPPQAAPTRLSQEEQQQLAEPPAEPIGASTAKASTPRAAAVAATEALDGGQLHPSSGHDFALRHRSPTSHSSAGGSGGGGGDGAGGDSGASGLERHDSPHEGAEEDEAEAFETVSPWEEPSPGVVRLAGLLFAYFFLTMGFDFAFVLGKHPALIALLAFAAASTAGAAARCWKDLAGAAGRPERESGKRVFLCPGLPWLPLAAIVANNFIIANLPALALVRFIVLECCMGSCFYFVRLRFRNLRTIRRLPGKAARKLPGIKPRKHRGVPGTVNTRAYAGFDLNDDDVDACTGADGLAFGPAPPFPSAFGDSPLGASADLGADLGGGGDDDDDDRGGAAPPAPAPARPTPAAGEGGGGAAGPFGEE